MKYTKVAQRVLQEARSYALQLGHGYVGTEHVLFALTNVPSYAADFLEQYKVTAEVIDEVIRRLDISDSRIPGEEITYAPQVEQLVQQAEDIARKMEMQEVGTEHLLLSLLTNPDYIGTRFLGMMNLPGGEMIHRIYHELGIPEPRNERRYQEIPMGPMMEEEPREESGPILDKFSTELTSPENIAKMDPIIGRDRETERMMEILCRRTKNNPILLGEAGVGKTAIVEGMAKRIYEGRVPEQLKNKRILRLDMAAMVAGTKYRGEFEERIKRCMDEVMADGNILLFMDEIHTLLGAGGAEGSLDASNIMKPALSRGQLQLIGATTTSEYRKHFERDAALARRFQTITVEEPTEEETVAILQGIQVHYEEHHQVSYTKEAITAAVRLSHRYISDRFLPDKAIDVLDEAGARKHLVAEAETTPSTRSKNNHNDTSREGQLLALQQQKEQAILRGDLAEAAKIRKEELELTQKLQKKVSLPALSGEDLQRSEKSKESDKKAAIETAEPLVVTEVDMENIIALWTGIPVSKVAESDTDRLSHLEERLHERVIGQNEAVTAVARAVRRGRLGLKDPRRPIGSFLLLGPTGVGKTELSKALSEALFGQEDALIRIDMSEYMEKYSVSKLIGSAPGYVGYEEGGQLSEKIRRKPYSVILFDEIEKAHPDVFNLLLQVLDDGHLTDSQGRKTDFKNTVILMTSNTGARSIQAAKHLGFQTDKKEDVGYERMKSGVMEEVKRVFRPEFLNRIDETIVFHALTETEIQDITRMMIRQIQGRVRDTWQMELQFTEEAVLHLAKAGYDPTYGARPLRRTLQTRVEDALADEILSGKVKAGDKVMISLCGDKITFTAE